MRAGATLRGPGTIAPVALLVAGCWGEVKPVWPDGPPQDTDTGTGEPAEPIPGGGLGGGAIDGRLDLFLFDEDGGGPVPGARLLLAAGSGDLDTVSGEDGHAVFEALGLAGPVEVHVLAEGFVPESFLALDASVATLLLRPADPAPDPQPATLSGTVTGWEELPEPTPSQRRVALVAFGPRWDELASAREPLVGVPLPKVEVEIDGADPSFELEVPPGPGVLHVFIGLRETYGTADETDDVHDWRFFDAITGLAPGPGESLSGLDLAADSFLPVEFWATLGAFPSAYVRAGMDLVCDMGDQGTLWVPGVRQAGKWLFAVPDQADLDVLVVPFLVARGDQPVAPEDGAGDVEATPLGRYVARDLGSLAECALNSPFVVPGMPSPPAQVGFDGEGFHCLPMAGTDLAQISVAGAGGGAESWRVTVFGVLPAEVGLPPFPADWGFGGFPDGPLLVRAWTADFPGEPAAWQFAGYPYLVQEVAFEAVEIE